ncbi:XRE family transcriptional regulator [Methylobacterium nodulans]|uniref:Transcriptional regulator, XRE family n=1 Tax=Methylobacterium nodulans (strain LMG 21967 / CNCM I-2342 / ORS 2060) TaxID=460265 RepID=B8IHR0_METNO|nr:XRE family transcriptional regulator [Methylobacterium nodulans]ACL61723.1 transcriptional regulator, XRE family [Methylobacterium nodulans ORS 2060]
MGKTNRTRLTPAEKPNRIAEWREKRGLTLEALAEATGFSTGYLSRMQNGSRNVSLKNLAKISEALKVPVADLVPEGEEVPPGGEASPIPLPKGMVRVIGIAKAGLFREVESLAYFVHDPIPAYPDTEFPHARQFAVLVEGDSMNAATPVPIPDGAKCICVDFDDINIPLRSGMKVVVEQIRDGGHLREWSVKEVKLFADRVEYHPRSTSREFKPIVVPKDATADTGRVVRVLGLVREVNARMPIS